MQYITFPRRDGSRGARRKDVKVASVCREAELKRIADSGELKFL
jgi:hypothetical protein